MERVKDVEGTRDKTLYSLCKILTVLRALLRSSEEALASETQRAAALQLDLDATLEDLAAMKGMSLIRRLHMLFSWLE